MEYKIIIENSTSLLEENVKFALNDGWEPIGGVFIESYQAPQVYQVKYGQTLIKKSKK